MRIRQLAVPAIVGLLIAFGAGPALAQEAPTGTFHYAAANFTNSPLWDVTGTYHLSGSSNGITDTATFVITNGVTGKITGSETETVNDGSITLNVDSTVTGKIGVRAGITGASLKSSGLVTGTLTGTAKGKSTAAVVESNLTVEVAVSSTLKLHAGHVKASRKFSAIVSTSLPSGMTGDWTLDTDITASGDKLSGTGMVTLSNGRVLTNSITGTYNTKSDTAKLKLTGEGAAKGTSLSMTTTNAGAGAAAMTLTGLKGKILGQKPMFP
jgi:hypothetical protein